MEGEIKSEIDLETEDGSSKATRGAFPDRIRISFEALQRLNTWSQQVADQLKCVKLSRGDLVNYLIMNRSEALSTSELKGIEAQFFDEVKFAHWAVDELKAAKERGESITLADVVAKNRPAPKIKRKRIKAPKEPDPLSS